MAREMEKRIEDVCSRILISSRNELYIHLRFFDVALSAFTYVMGEQNGELGTDGVGIYYDPGYLGGLYRQGRREVNRAYLHMMLHCLLVHLWKKVRIRKKLAAKALGISREDEENGQEDLTDILWDLACDISVESIIDGLALHCVKKPMSRDRKNLYASLRKKRKTLHAEGVFEELVKMQPSREQALLWEREFHCDDHRLWKGSRKNPPSQRPEKNWEDIRDRMETEIETFGQDMARGQSGLKEQIKAENRDTRDYRQFLSKFAVLREEQMVDPDSFDYIFYSYGMSLYGNMPLLEPQETREVKKIQDFVIAIDTSMSCSGELVRGFLRETYSVLREQESFFRRMQIHVIQCDERIQSDRLITSQEELKEYMENLELAGKGGTDFRPVFAYIREKQRKGELRGLKGLLYFTDGKGIFPERMPPYDVAFLLMQKEYEEVEVPCWAMKLYLDEEELLERNERTEE